jgi:hypothetical protein
MVKEKPKAAVLVPLAWAVFSQIAYLNHFMIYTEKQ